MAKLPTLFPAISFKRYEPGPIEKSLRWIVRSFHLTVAATGTRLPGDARPRNDRRGDSTIFMPNSEPSPQTYRGSALQRLHRSGSRLHYRSVHVPPPNFVEIGRRTEILDLEIRRADPAEPNQATNADHCCRGHRNLLSPPFRLYSRDSDVGRWPRPYCSCSDQPSRRWSRSSRRS